MKNIRRITLMLAMLAAWTLGCQTVTSLFSPTTPTPRLRPTLPAVPKPATTVPKSGAPTQPSVEEPTQPGIQMPTLPALPGLGAGVTLSSPSDTETALAASTPPQFLEQLATEKYTESEMQQMNHTFPYTIMLSGEQPVVWDWGWCATTQDILDQNLKQISVKFTMNGQPVALDQFYAYDSQETDAQGNTLACHSWATVASNWPNVTALQTVVTFASKINDGINDYPAGSQTFIYAVTLP